MKQFCNRTFWIFFLSAIVFVQCGKSKDDTVAPPVVPPPNTTSVVADFEVQLTDSIAPGEVLIKNKTTGATNFQWNFGNGTQNTLKDPGKITFNEQGIYTITLTASNSTESKTFSRIVAIKRNNVLITYSDIKLGVWDSHQTFGACFSTSMEKIYKPNEINDVTGPKIDITLVGASGARYFCSPLQMSTQWSSLYKIIPGATITKFINYYTGNIPINVADFDQMNTDSLLQGLTIVDDQAIYSGRQVPFLIFFQNAIGQKGIIKVKEDKRDGQPTDYFVLFDLKMQTSPQ
jgi:PKD repeat protein